MFLGSFLNLVLYRIIFDDLDNLLCNKVHTWKIGLATIHDGLYYPKNTQVEQ